MSEQTPHTAPIPRHVGIIMDGNGRWARQRSLPRLAGHREGAQSVRTVVRTARQRGIQALTLYAFSAQNWNRPQDEVVGLMELLRDYVVQERSEIMDNDIRLTAIGAIDRMPAFVTEPLNALVDDSRDNHGMTLTLALSYGGRESITAAVRKLAAAAVAGDIPANVIDETAISAALPTAALPDLDLLIRTSGELRISNFMLWELAYAELLFVDTAWPDFRQPEFLSALDEYAKRQRRFGLLDEQIAGDSDVEPRQAPAGGKPLT